MIVNCGLSESPFQKAYQIWESYDFDPNTVVVFPNHRSCRHFQKEIQNKLSNIIFPKIYSITNLFHCDVQPVDILNILSTDLCDIPIKTIHDLAVEIANSIKELILNKIDYRTLQNQVPQDLQPYWSKTQYIFQQLDKIISQLEKIRDHQIEKANTIIEKNKVIAVELGMANLCVTDFLKRVEKSTDNTIVLLSLDAPINRKIKSLLFEKIPCEETIFPIKNHIEKAVFQNINEEILGVAIAIRQAIFENKKVLIVTQSQDFTYKLKEQLSRWNIVPDAALGTQLIDTFEGKLLILVSEVLQNNFDCNSMINLLKACKIDINSFEIFRRKLTLAPNNFFDCYDLYDEKNAHISEIITFLKKLEYDQKMPFRDWIDLSYSILNAVSNAHSNILKNNEFYKELSNNIMITSNEFASFLHNTILTQTTQKPTGYTKNVVIVGAIEAQLLSADLIILACVNTENLITEDNNTFLTRAMKQRLNIPTSEHQNNFIASIFERLINQPNVLITRSLCSNDIQQEYPLLKNYSVTDSYIKNLTSIILYNVPPTKKATRPFPVINILPSTISVSNIDLLINNPYAFYVRTILKLKEIPPIIKTTTTKGNFIHEILHRSIQKKLYSNKLLWEEVFKIIESNRLKISDIGPVFFQLQTVFDFFIKNISDKSISYTEIPGRYTIKLDKDLGEITLVCRADRLDIDQNGFCSIIDYKTGTPPSSKEVKSLKKIQLLAEAIIAKNNGFKIPISDVVSLQYWYVKNAPKIIEVINKKDIQSICSAALNKIRQLLQKHSYEFIASAEYNEIYKHLARYKEWRID